MKYKAIVFKDGNAQRVYDNYMKGIKNVVKPIPVAEREEVMMEFNSHIYECMQMNNDVSELESLLDSIDKLGAPDEVLKPLVADKLLEKATRSFNPIDVFKALVANLTNGVAYFIFFILYALLGTFVFLIFAKMFNKEVGMYYREGKFQAIGMVYGQEGAVEVLGHWFIPVMILCIIFFYMVITLLLKIKKSFNKKLKS